VSVRSFSIGLLALALGALHSFPATAQSADLVLCDRVAADPSDKDKPADVVGVNSIAPSDVATSIKFCKTASGSSRRALFQLGRAYAANRQLPEAIAAYRKAADKGSAAAMAELGVLYSTGAGIAKDPAEARKLFERAAAAGNSRAIANLSALSGSSAMDPAKTRALLSTGADTNSAEAQFQLGLMAANGTGGAQDDVAARSLFEKAAAQGHAEAMVWMGAFAELGRGGPADEKLARSYFEKAAALGNEEAKDRIKRLDCPRVLKDKKGNIISYLCF